MLLCDVCVAVSNGLMCVRCYVCCVDVCVRCFVLLCDVRVVVCGCVRALYLLRYLIIFPHCYQTVDHYRHQIYDNVRSTCGLELVW